MFLINQDNLLIKGNGKTIILIDVKNRLIKKKFTFVGIYEANIDNESITILNKNKFLYLGGSKLLQYEFEDSDTIVLKEENDMFNELIVKYPGNKIIIYEHKTISIYG